MEICDAAGLKKPDISILADEFFGGCETSAAERGRGRKDLEAYCALDTLGLVQIADQLTRQ